MKAYKENKKMTFDQFITEEAGEILSRLLLEGGKGLRNALWASVCSAIHREKNDGWKKS